MNAEKAEPASVEQTPTRMDNVIDIRDIIREIVRRWWLILLFAGYGVWSGATDMHRFQPMSKAVMVVEPVGSSSGRQGGAQLGGAVSVLTGISLGRSSQSSKFDRLVFVTKSLTLARELDKDHNLMNKIYGEGWELAAARKKIEDASKDESWRLRLRRYLKLPMGAAPTIEDLAGYIGGSFKATDIPSTSFKRIEFVHRDPKMALWYLNIVFDAAEKQVNIREKIHLLERRRYLEGRLRSTDISEFHDGLIGLITQLSHEEMMSEGETASVAKIIEPAYIAKAKTAPDVLRYIGLPVFIAIAAAITLILVVFLIRTEK